MFDSGVRRLRGLGRRAANASLALVGALLLAACSSPVHLMPTPVKFTASQGDPFANKIIQEDRTAIPLLYATNRAALVESRHHPVYTIFPSDTLRLGVAHVRIGDGTLDWNRVRELSTSASEARRPILNLERMEELLALGPHATVESSPEALEFFANINAALARSPRKELIIYVHGFNNPVWRGAAQAAQFHHFTGRQAVVLAFLWPSAGRLLSYATDVRAARASVPAFARLIELLSKYTEARQINVLAFSAGARIASEGLAQIAQTADGETREQLRARMRLGQVYFAAPDEDLDRFIADLGAYIDLTQRVSVGANFNDAALRLAARLQRISRAGRPNVDELDAAQWDFLTAASMRLNFDMIRVDPDEIPGLRRRSHDFWQANAWVSSDLLMQFLWHKAPQERGLEPQFTSTGMRFWTFPPDYEERVERVLRQR